MCGLFRRVKPEVEASKAREALAAGRADEAAERCEAALKANPDHAECRTLLARAYERLDRVGDAIEAYEAACAAAPSYPNFLAAATLHAKAGGGCVVWMSRGSRRLRTGGERSSPSGCCAWDD